MILSLLLFTMQLTQHFSSNIALSVCRLLLTGSAGLRAVEVRGGGGVVLGSWQFVGSKLRNQFLIPVQTLSGAQLLVAEDSHGNLLKVNV